MSKINRLTTTGALCAACRRHFCRECINSHAFTAISASLLVLSSFCLIGCGPTLTGTDIPEEDIGRPVEQFVTVAFRNLSTSDAVNVEFHSTSTPVTSLPDDLFTDETAITSGIGVAGTGILVPGATDVFEVTCTDSLIIGTAGGEFLDNETGEPIGRGQPLWLEARAAALCGAVVGFTFDGSDGTFLTTVEIRR